MYVCLYIKCVYVGLVKEKTYVHVYIHKCVYVNFCESEDVQVH